MGTKFDYQNDTYSDGFEITPASDTEVAEHRALLVDADGSVVVRFRSGGTPLTLSAKAGIPLRVRVYSVDSLVTATTVHGLL